jgi:hypothetical protein
MSKALPKFIRMSIALVFSVALGLLAAGLTWATVARTFPGFEQLGAAVVIVPVTFAVVGCIVFRESREKGDTGRARE